MPSITLHMKPFPPFRLDLTVWVLKRRPDYVIDEWDGETYRRTLRVDGRLCGVAVRQVAPPDEAELEITLTGSAEAIALANQVTRAVEKLLGTTINLNDFYQFAETDERLRPLARRFKGFKPTRYPTIFECLTNAITCQMVSLNVGLQVVSRLVNAYGNRLDIDPTLPPAFPTPGTIAGSDPDHLRQIGFSRQKARALIELAQGLELGEIDFSSLSSSDDATAIRQLTALRGVGRWTAEYTLLRGLGRLHMFPGDDVGARNTLKSWSQSTETLNYDRVRETLNGWEPYAGLLYFHMLLLGLESRGRIEAQTG